MREPNIYDVPWLYEASKDWPPTPQKGWVTFDKVDGWVRRWIAQDDEHCRILEVDGEPVGYITYSYGPYVAKVWQIVTHPEHRQKGHANQMIEWLTKELFSKGVLVATFDTLPGPIRNKYPNGEVTAFD